MATRGEMARYWSERSGPKKAKGPPRRRRDLTTDTSRPGVSATDRRARRGATGSWNESPRAGKNAAYALEPCSGKPSRRSTRASGNRALTTGKLRLARARPG